MTGPDAVVVGSGPNGLAAALTLARAGLSVQVFEGAAEPGGGCRTAELTLPGFRHDVCSAVHPLALASPFFGSLNLAARGIRLLTPKVAAAHPLDGGRAGAVSGSVAETAGRLGADARAYRRLMEPLVRDAEPIVRMVMAPLRSLPDALVPAARFAAEGLLPAALLTRRLHTAEGRALFAGMASHSLRPLSAPLTGAFALTFLILAHTTGWPVVQGGSGQLVAAMSAELAEHGGSVVTGTWVERLEQLPRAKVVLLDVTPRQLLRMAGNPDAVSRPRAEQVAADEIFFGPKPCLMVIEQHRRCWLSGRLTTQRTGEEWAKEFGQLPPLRPTTPDGGTALAQGLELVHDQRRQQGQAAVVAQDDHFHVQREGQRVVRQLQRRVTERMDQAEAADRKAATKARRTGDGRGRGAAVLAWRRAERAMDAYAAAAAAWEEVEGALQLWTPQGTLNTRTRARAIIDAALPRLSDPAWAKVQRSLARPQLLAFLDDAAARLAALPLPEEVREAALRVEGLRRQPEALRGEGPSARALRGLVLVAGVVLSLSGTAGERAVTQVGAARRGVWRASSLVECLNSVARLQQSRHRKMTPGLLDLKRLYWNCRQFRPGRRRNQTPYGLQGLRLPTEDWWQLLKLTPQQLREQLGLPEPPAQELSAPTVAA